MFEYQLKRSARRKTVAIKVSQKLVTVYAPTHVPKLQIEQWLFSKKEWVTAQLHKQLNAIDTQQHPFKNQQIMVFAKPYTITFAKGTKEKVHQHHHGSERRRHTARHAGLVHACVQYT